ncbi:hypothetical protein C8T65DRAFT_659818 [Cerioporus squamosus]|nr:hypothetical protein C8T65DRAFT_659818 [Cerioporus squamosus]
MSYEDNDYYGSDPQDDCIKQDTADRFDAADPPGSDVYNGANDNDQDLGSRTRSDSEHIAPDVNGISPDDDTPAPDDNNTPLDDDRAVPDDGNIMFDDDGAAPDHLDVGFNIRLTRDGDDDDDDDDDSESPANNRGMHGNAHASQLGPNYQGATDQVCPFVQLPYPRSRTWGADYDWADPGSQPSGQQGGGCQRDSGPTDSVQHNRQDPRSHPPPSHVDTHPLAGSPTTARRASIASQNPVGDDNEHASKSYGFMEDFLSQTGAAVQNGMVKGISNSVAQATEGVLKHLGSSFHLHSNLATAQSTAKPASASHNARPPAAGSAGVKPQPSQAHSVPSVASATLSRPIESARPTGTGKPHTAGMTAQRPGAAASSQKGSTAAARPSIQLAGGNRAPTQGTVVVGTGRRPNAAEQQELPGRGNQQTK